jgi:SAM-dependent methyltransferase
MASQMTTISACEVCDSADLHTVLDLGSQPMCDDLVPIGNPAQPQKYPLELLLCPRCLTVHQKYQVEKSVLFPQTYHYRAAMTEDVIAGMADLVDLSKRLYGNLTGAVVLDIGCNDGSLLKLFGDHGAETVGIEPTGAAEDAKTRVHNVFNSYFDSGSVAEYLSRFPKPDIITFTNVFAHIEDLGAVIDCLLKLSKEDTILIIENHYLGSVLKRFQFDTFYHEHPRTYSFRSFEYIANKLDMKIVHVDFPPRYNGNIRVALRKRSLVSQVQVDESTFLNSFPVMKTYIEETKLRMMECLYKLSQTHGPLPAKAFPGRASVIISYFGIDETMLGATYERSASPKVGYYIPGTRIPILDEVELFKNPDTPIIVNLAWHIREEIHRYLRMMGCTGEVLDIFS